MMKFAQFECGKCRRSYDSHIDTGAYMPCPKCGQFNVVVHESMPITGRCDRCNKPLESNGHEWWHDQFIECRNVVKK
jgi:DNA-directed RNA polymerase subunit RPC12/RpoP